MGELIHLFSIPKDVLNDNERQRRVYSPMGISPSLLARSDGPKILIGGEDMDIIKLGMLDMKGAQQIRRVYDVDGISPTLDTAQGGHRQTKILVGDDVILDDTQGFDGLGIYNDYSPTLRVQRSGLKTFGGDGLIKLKVNDFFCGAGGMGIGFKNADWDISGAWDFDKYAVQSYAHNVGDHVEQADITKMDWTSIPYAHCWTFGFPCQDLSVAGKQEGWKMKCNKCDNEIEVNPETALMSYDCEKCEGEMKAETRSALFFEVMRLLDETNEHNPNNLPPVIMAENVKGLKKFLPVMEREYNKRGYKMVHTLYNSKFWGVPQNRERYFVVGVHESIQKEFVFPEQQEYFVPRLSVILESEVDEKYYIDNEKAEKIIEQAKERINVSGMHSVITPDRVDKRQNGRRAKAEEEEEMFTLTAQDRHGIIADPSQARREGEHRIYKEYAPTLNARDYKEPRLSVEKFRVRKLTPREYARLQGFPESFEIIVSDTQAYKQFGNAVTVNVSQDIAERLKMFLLSL